MQKRFLKNVWLTSLLIVATILVFAGSVSALFEDSGITESIRNVDYAFKQRSGDTVTLHIYKFWDGTEKVAVIYNPNGGIGQINAVPLDINSDYAITDQGYTRSGYSFAEWNTKADCTGDFYFNGQTVTMSKSLTLYAQWTTVVPPTYTLTYDANGGDSNSIPAPQSRSGQGDLIISLVEPVRSGYDFLGWSENFDDSAAQYQPDDLIYMDSDKTLYAVWELEEEQFFTITYNPNGGEGEIKVYYVKPGDDYTITSQGYTRTFYVFYGWNTMENGYGLIYNNGNIITNVDRDIVLYARWARLM